MSARARWSIACNVDLKRFAAAVGEGLTNPELAERFGISRGVASRLAAPVRRKSVPGVTTKGSVT